MLITEQFARHASLWVLAQARLRARTVLERLSAAENDAVIIRNTAGAIIYVNDAALRINGQPRHALFGSIPGRNGIAHYHGDGTPVDPHNSPSMLCLRSERVVCAQLGMVRTDDVRQFVFIEVAPLPSIGCVARYYLISAASALCASSQSFY